MAASAAETKAKELSSEAERREAVVARKAAVESQRQVGSLKQEAAKVHLAAPTT